MKLPGEIPSSMEEGEIKETKEVNESITCAGQEAKLLMNKAAEMLAMLELAKKRKMEFNPTDKDKETLGKFDYDGEYGVLLRKMMTDLSEVGGSMLDSGIRIKANDKDFLALYDEMEKKL